MAIECLNGRSAKQRGVLRKESTFKKMIQETSLLVRRKEVFSATRGKDLIMVLLASDTTNYLLITVLESWVYIGCEESKVVDQDKLRALDPVRLYENTSTVFWVSMQKKIMDNEIWVGGDEAE